MIVFLPRAIHGERIPAMQAWERSDNVVNNHSQNNNGNTLPKSLMEKSWGEARKDTLMIYGQYHNELI